MSLVRLASCLLALVCGSCSGLQCVDETGRDVDWAILYKLPKEPRYGRFGGGGIVDEGLSYVYVTSASPESDWTLSERSIEDPLSIPGRTLAPLYRPEEAEGLAYVFYNDEHPDGSTSFTGGHTKGVAAFNSTKGFWLVHSVPKYPPELGPGAGYSYPATGHRYGQTFLCVSLPTAASADTVGTLMTYNDPYIYSRGTPPWARRAYPEFVAASEGRHVTKAPYFTVRSLRSPGGIAFTAFAKCVGFGKDLYADLVAPALKTSLLVESWPNGPGKMNSSCDKPFPVLNVDELLFADVVDARKRVVDFTTRHDHAKWAVATNKGGAARNVVCLGDINRMETQKHRGGGTVCFADRHVWKTFTKIIKEIESCPSKWWAVKPTAGSGGSSKNSAQGKPARWVVDKWAGEDDLQLQQSIPRAEHGPAALQGCPKCEEARGGLQDEA